MIKRKTWKKSLQNGCFIEKKSRTKILEIQVTSLTLLEPNKT